MAGPGAPAAALLDALDRATNADTVVLVEGISDQIAVETLARCHGRDLARERIVVVPIGGAQAIGRSLDRFGPRGAGLVVVGLCDAGEERHFCRALTQAGIGSPQSRAEMAELGFFVCDRDLESELIRAHAPATIESVLAAQDDLSAFRTLQKQPPWRGEPFADQMHRWLRAGSQRNCRYAALLVEAMAPRRAPAPLQAVLVATRPI